MAQIVNSIVDAIGQTPLVRLNRLSEGLPGNIAVKLEFYNPAPLLTLLRKLVR